MSAYSDQKKWTAAEVRRAAAMWGECMTLAEIGKALGRSHSSVKHQAERHRRLFPSRHTRKVADPVEIKMMINGFIDTRLKMEAQRRGISRNKLVREALEQFFVPERPA